MLDYIVDGFATVEVLHWRGKERGRRGGREGERRGRREREGTVCK